MKYLVVLRDALTGEIRRFNPGVPWGEASVFWWTEGNMSCDSNRVPDFARAGGATEEEVAVMDVKCSHGQPNKIEALWAELEDGTKVPLDRA